jgi:hypothetical protein
MTIALPVGLLLVMAAEQLLHIGRDGISVPDDLDVVSVVLGAASATGAIGLIAGRRIGWLLALSIVGWLLVASLAQWWLGAPSYLGMALATGSALLVTSPEMRTAYRGLVEE